MAKTKIYKSGWYNTPNAFFLSAMRTTDQRNAEVETANQQWIASRSAFRTAFTTLDDAYQRSLMSFSSKTIAEKDDERDIYGQVLEQVSKQWARLPDETMAIHGRRVWQVFRDIDFRTSEALVAENEKITNIEQRFGEATLQQDLQAMSLTQVNQRFATLTQEIIQLMNERNEESAARVQGELKAAS